MYTQKSNRPLSANSEIIETPRRFNSGTQKPTEGKKEVDTENLEAQEEDWYLPRNRSLGWMVGG